MPNIFQVIRSSSELAELKVYLESIKPVITDPKISVIEKRKTLCTMVDSLTEKTFKNDLIAEQILEIINMKEDECKKFVDSKTQVESILAWLPRFEYHRNKLEQAVKKSRQSYGLKV